MVLSRAGFTFCVFFCICASADVRVGGFIKPPELYSSFCLFWFLSGSRRHWRGQRKSCLTFSFSLRCSLVALRTLGSRLPLTQTLISRRFLGRAFSNFFPVWRVLWLVNCSPGWLIVAWEFDSISPPTSYRSFVNFCRFFSPPLTR